MKELNNDIIHDLLVKTLLGEASPEEVQAVERWKAASPENRKLAEDVATVWKRSREIAEASRMDEQQAWSRFRTKLHDPERFREANVVPMKRRWKWPVAAAWILLVGIAATIMYHFGFSHQETFSATNRSLAVQLPDASAVSLNKNSSVTYASAPLSGERKVKLQGEAFFEVKKTGKPFRVYVNNTVVTVLGTSFYIDGRSKHTAVQVKTGLVQVVHNRDTVLLHPGEKISLHNEADTLVKETAHGRLYEVFVSGEIVCDNTPLSDLVELLRQEYGAIIVLGDSAVGNMTITTTFKDMSLDEILKVVQQTLGVKVDRKDKKYLIRS